MADNKTATIAFRISQEIKERLQEAAKKDRRSLSQYIEITLINHLMNLAADATIQGAFLRSL